MKLKNGGELLDKSDWIGVALAKFRGQYVTWDIDKEGECFSGNYFDDLQDALDNYLTRLITRAHLMGISETLPRPNSDV